MQTQLAPVPLSKTERGLARYEGGSEVDVLKEGVSAGITLSDSQTTFLNTEDEIAWKRPSLDLRGQDSTLVPAGTADAPRESVYGKC